MSVDHGTGNVKSPASRRDAFLGGRLMVAQPAKGFRAGSDSVLLGASVSVPSGELLDMGCGAGVAGLSALAHHEGLNAALADNNAQMLGFARTNIDENGMTARARLLDADVTAPGAEREANGLSRDHFAAVIANPPFFDQAGGTRAPDAGRAAARHMGANALDQWLKAAAAAAAPGAEAIFIYPAAGLTALLAGFDNRFGAVTVLPLCPRPGEEASRVLVRGIKGSRAPLRLLSPIALHGPVGNAYAPQIDAVLRGTSRLMW